MKTIINCKIISVLLCFGTVLCIDEVLIKTTSGSVKGQKILVFNQTVDQFLGIPFAESPVGSLRFAKPKPIVKPLEAVIDATKPKNSCIQQYNEEFVGNITTSEDCLVLNIWSQNIGNGSNKLKPVMFWIYGGALVLGPIFQKQYNGSVLATNDIVLVSANYRVGFLGFLYGDREDAPGNMGFYDQLLALQWVRDNIHLFGGDKSQITIFGESAGSWSVSAHLLSPLSKGLFKRAIMQSGSILNNKNRPYSTKDQALSVAKRKAKRLNCTDDNQWLECLKKVDANEFSTETDEYIAIHPIGGTEFLPLSPQKSFIELEFNKDLELIAGITRNEGSTLAYHLNPEFFNSTNISRKDFINYIEQINSTYHNLFDFNIEKLVDQYLRDISDPKDSEAIKWKIYDFYGDYFLKCPTYLFAKRYAQKSSVNSKVYFYEFEHSAKGDEYEKQFGIYHSADIDFVFGLQLLQPNSFSKENIDFSKQMVKIWTDFAKTGNPDNYWFPLIVSSTGNTTSTFALKPKQPNDHASNLVNLFSDSCDGFFKNYF